MPPQTVTPSSAQARRTWLPLFITIAAIWGGSFLFMRVAGLEFGIFPSACLRMAFGALVMLPLIIWRGLWGQLLQHWQAILWLGLFNAAIPFASYAFAVLHITTALAAILNATGPMFSALVAWVWLKHGLTPSRVIGLAIGFLGIALLVGAEANLKEGAFGLSMLAILACLLAALCYAISGNAIKARFSHLHPWVVAGGTMLGAALWLLIPALLSMPTQMPSLSAWGALFVVGVLCSAIALMLYFELLLRVDATKAMSVTYLIPVFAAGYGAVFLAESVTPRMLGCALVIAIGTALATGLQPLNWLKPKNRS